MGILTDFFVATPEEALAADLRLGPARRFPTVELKSVDIVKVLQLDAILGNHPLDLGQMMPVGEQTKDGPWLFQLPPALVHRLATFTDEQSAAIGRRWGQTPEWAMEPGASEFAVQQAIRSLMEISRRARAAGKPVLLWWSL